MSIILFVDDDRSILQLTKIQLNSLKKQNITVNSGKSLIELFLQKKHYYEQEVSLIFLDLTMPGMSGLEVLAWLDRQNIKVPVIVQTGIEDQIEIGKALALGAKDYLLKPYNKEALKHYIHKWEKVTAIT